MPIKVKILTPIPHSLTYGGVEMKSQKYIDYISKYKHIDISFLDFYDSSEDYDILHIVGASIDTARPAIYAKRKNKKVVISPIWYKEQNLNLLKAMNFVFKKVSFVPNSFSLVDEMLTAADVILNNNHEEKRQLMKIFSTPENKFVTVYNGVDLDMFENVENKRLFNEKYNLDQYILSVSMIDPRKNTQKLIEAFLQLDTDHKLVLLGDFRMFNEQYNSKIKKLIAENKDRIIITGLIKHNSQLMKSAFLNADIHVLPSILETPGNSNLEACLAGCKVLVGECDAIREYFHDNIYYCDQFSVQDIAAKLQTLLNMNGHDKQNQIDFIKAEFSWDRTLTELKNVYESLA